MDSVSVAVDSVEVSVVDDDVCATTITLLRRSVMGAAVAVSVVD